MPASTPAPDAGDADKDPGETDIDMLIDLVEEGQQRITAEEGIRQAEEAAQQTVVRSVLFSPVRQLSLGILLLLAVGLGAWATGWFAPPAANAPAGAESTASADAAPTAEPTPTSNPEEPVSNADDPTVQPTRAVRRSSSSQPEAEPADASRAARDAEIQETFRRLFEQAEAAAKARDYLALTALLAERRRLVAEVSAPRSDLLKTWKQDHAIIQQAEALIAQTRYRKAVELMQARYTARRTDEPANGDLALTLFRAAISAVVLEDKPVLSLDELRDIIYEAGQDDPMHLELRVIGMWMAPSDPHEELLRLDVRSAVLERNRQLLPIKHAFQQALGEDFSRSTLTPAETNQQLEALTAHGVPAELARRILAPLDFALGQSREPAWAEYREWQRALQDRTWTLRDREGNRLLLTHGLLWRQTVTQQGPTWQLLEWNGGQWMASDLLLMRRVDHDLAWDRGREKQQVLHAALERHEPLERLAPLAGRHLELFGGRVVELTQLLEMDVPVVRLPLSLLRTGWTRGGAELDKRTQGTALKLRHRELNQVRPVLNHDWDAHGRRWHSSRDDAWFREYTLPNLLVLVDRPRLTKLVPMEDDQGLYFPTTDGKQIRLTDRPSFMLRTRGRGSVHLPIEGGGFEAAAVTRLVRDIHHQSANFNRHSTGRHFELHAAVAELRELINAYGSRPDASLEEMVAAAVSQRGKPFNPNRIRQLTAMQRRAVSRRYDIVRKRVQQSLARLPYGVDRRNRFVVLDSSGTELRFLDEDGREQDQFYSRRQLTTILHDTVTDFLQPSFNLVISPLTFGTQATDAANPPRTGDALLGLMQQVAEEAWKQGDLHLALTMYREMPSPAFTEFPADFESTGPINEADLQTLTDMMAQSAADGAARLRARMALSQLMREAQRPQTSDELRATLGAEWNSSALPLYDRLKAFAQSYGYLMPREYVQQAAALQQLAGQLEPPAPVQVAVDETVNASVVHELAGHTTPFERGKVLEAFYNRRPGFAAYREVKHHLAEHHPELLQRRPPTSATLDLLLQTWTPTEVRQGDLQQARPFRNREAAEGSVTWRWERLLHAAEIGSLAEVRRTLIQLAAAEREQAAEHLDGSLNHIAHSVNAIAALWLAAAADKAVFGPAHFDVAVLQATKLELDNFIRPQLISAGQSQEQITSLLGPIETMMQLITRQSHDDHYRLQRYYWFEYAPLMHRMGDSAESRHARSSSPR